MSSAGSPPGNASRCFPFPRGARRRCDEVKELEMVSGEAGIVRRCRDFGDPRQRNVPPRCRRRAESIQAMPKEPPEQVREPPAPVKCVDDSCPPGIMRGAAVAGHPTATSVAVQGVHKGEPCQVANGLPRSLP